MKSSLISLELALHDGNPKEVRGLLNEWDLKTEADVFLKAANVFGFETVEHRGRRYEYRAQIATILEYVNESGLRKLCKKWDLDTLPGRDQAVRA